MPTRLKLLALILLLGCSCGKTEPSISLTGTWKGSFSDSGMTAGLLTWQIAQTNNQISGPLSGNDAGTGILTFQNATSAGTLSGTSLSSTWTFPLGSVVLLPSCSATMYSQATITNNTMAGTYSGTNSCTGAVSNGQFNLTKQ